MWAKQQEVRATRGRAIKTHNPDGNNWWDEGNDNTTSDGNHLMSACITVQKTTTGLQTHRQNDTDNNTSMCSELVIYSANSGYKTNTTHTTVVTLTEHVGQINGHQVNNTRQTDWSPNSVGIVVKWQLISNVGLPFCCLANKQLAMQRTHFSQISYVVAKKCSYLFSLAHYINIHTGCFGHRTLVNAN